MVELTDSQIAAAATRGALARAHEPRARSARYDSRSGRIIVELANNCVFAFPAALAQGLETATTSELSQIEILGGGYGLHWEKLDVDLSIPGLLAGIFGTRKHMASLAGKTRSAAKAAAARANGAKGGRPKKSA